MNEPHDLTGGCNTWQTLVQASITAIRRIDNTHFILVPGYSWQSANSWPNTSDCLANITDPANKIIFSAHQYFDSNFSGQTYNSSPCSDTQRGITLSQPFLNWLSQNNKKGIFTEYGVTTNSCWMTTLDIFLTSLNTNPQIVGGTYWAAGPAWGNYGLSVEPANGQDKPQMSVLQKYPSK